MADTQRTIAALQALLADNTSGDISPQDVRDMLETFRPDHGELSLSSSSVTTIANQNGWTKAAGTTVLTGGGVQMNFDDDGGINNRLRYNGTVGRVMHVACSLSMSPAATNKTYEFAIVKNGSISTSVDTNDTIDDVNSAASVIRTRVSSSDVSAFALHAFMPMNPTDYIELYARNITDAANLTVETVNFFAMGMPNG